MAVTFKLYTDATLTTEFDWSGTDKLTFTASGDTVLYFGSTDSTKKCQASGGGNFDITPTDSVGIWAATTAHVLNDEIQPTTDLGYYFKCTTAGTSGGSEPTWSGAATEGDTIADGTITWTNQGPHHEKSEIKLATTSGGLGSATGGAALTITAPVNGGVANKREIHVRATDGTGGGVAQTNLSLVFDALEELAI